MSRTLSESSVVSALADEVCRRLTRRLIATLQKLNNALLSGEDSGLKNTWDEICAQVQFEESYAWDAYDETVRGLAASGVEKLQPHEREAIWLQTTAADDWDCEDESRRRPYPVSNEEIVDYLVDEYVYRDAGNWSNLRIRNYLDRSIRTD
jgi:hypothetical protein